MWFWREKDQEMKGEGFFLLSSYLSISFILLSLFHSLEEEGEGEESGGGGSGGEGGQLLP